MRTFIPIFFALIAGALLFAALHFFAGIPKPISAAAGGAFAFIDWLTLRAVFNKITQAKDEAE